MHKSKSKPQQNYTKVQMKQVGHGVWVCFRRERLQLRLQLRAKPRTPGDSRLHTPDQYVISVNSNSGTIWRCFQLAELIVYN